MNVVDSSAWLSFFADDSNASKFEKAILDIDDLVVPSIVLTEVFKRIIQQKEEDFALEAIAHMQQATVVPLDATLALDAAHYGIAHKLPLADSIVYATAQKYKAVLWTQDADFKGLERVKYFKR